MPIWHHCRTICYLSFWKIVIQLNGRLNKFGSIIVFGIWRTVSINSCQPLEALDTLCRPSVLGSWGQAKTWWENAGILLSLIGKSLKPEYKCLSSNNRQGPPISEQLSPTIYITPNFSFVISQIRRFKWVRSLVWFGLQISSTHSRIEHLLKVLSRERFSCQEYFMKSVILPVLYQIIIDSSPSLQARLLLCHFKYFGIRLGIEQTKFELFSDSVNLYR
jgi:hypothetical protein